MNRETKLSGRGFRISNFKSYIAAALLILLSPATTQTSDSSWNRDPKKNAKILRQYCFCNNHVHVPLMLPKTWQCILGFTTFPVTDSVKCCCISSLFRSPVYFIYVEIYVISVCIREHWSRAPWLKILATPLPASSASSDLIDNLQINNLLLSCMELILLIQVCLFLACFRS